MNILTVLLPWVGASPELLPPQLTPAPPSLPPTPIAPSQDKNIPFSPVLGRLGSIGCAPSRHGAAPALSPWLGVPGDQSQPCLPLPAPPWCRQIPELLPFGIQISFRERPLPIPRAGVLSSCSLGLSAAPLGSSPAPFHLLEGENTF